MKTNNMERHALSSLNGILNSSMPMPIHKSIPNYCVFESHDTMNIVQRQPAASNEIRNIERNPIRILYGLFTILRLVVSS